MLVAGLVVSVVCVVRFYSSCSWCRCVCTVLYSFGTLAAGLAAPVAFRQVSVKPQPASLQLLFCIVLVYLWLASLCLCFLSGFGQAAAGLAASVVICKELPGQSRNRITRPIQGTELPGQSRNSETKPIQKQRN